MQLATQPRGFIPPPGLIVPRKVRRALDLKTFEPWRLFKPKLALDGQFAPYQALHLEDPQVPGYGLGGTPDATITYQSNASNTGTVTNFSFATQGIGTASADRVVFVAAGFANSTASITALTVGGISAVAGPTVSGTSTRCSIWAAAVPTGTTATIALTNASASRCVIIVWSSTGILSTTATHSQTGSNSLSPTSGNLSCNAGGVMVCAVNMTDQPLGFGVWTGVSSGATVSNGGSGGAVGGQAAFAAAQSSLAITVTHANDARNARTFAAYR